MRSTPFFAALLVVVALAALSSSSAYARPSRDGRRRGTATLVGDSLNVGVEPYLADALPGLAHRGQRPRRPDDAEGIAELEADGRSLSPFVVVSLGTNDPPRTSTAFRADVARVLRARRRRAAASSGRRSGATARPSDAFNDVLREAAASNRRLRLVDWAEMVQRAPRLARRATGSTANELGYRERARAIADAVR